MDVVHSQVAQCAELEFKALLCLCGLQVLQEFCNEAIASKPTTLEGDIKQYRKLQADASSHARTKLALQFRIAIKQLLHTCAWQYDPSQA